MVKHSCLSRWLVCTERTQLENYQVSFVQLMKKFELPLRESIKIVFGLCLFTPAKVLLWSIFVLFWAFKSANSAITITKHLAILKPQLLLWYLLQSSTDWSPIRLNPVTSSFTDEQLNPSKRSRSKPFQLSKQAWHQSELSWLWVFCIVSEIFISTRDERFLFPFNKMNTVCLFVNTATPPCSVPSEHRDKYSSCS